MRYRADHTHHDGPATAGGDERPQPGDAGATGVVGLTPTRRRHRAFALGGLLLVALALAPARAAAAPPEGARQAQAKRKLGEVRAQIKALVARQRQAGERRDDLSAQLAQQARTLAAAAAAAQAAQAAVSVGEAKLKPLQAERTTLQRQLHAQRSALAELLRASYALGSEHGLQLLLGALATCPAPAATAPPAATPPPSGDACAASDGALARLDRALAYSRYFQHDRTGRIHALLGQLSQLQAVRAAIDAQQAALQSALEQQNERLVDLHAQRAAQQKALATADAKARAQGKRLKSLKRDERDLKALLRRLHDVFADLPRQLPGEVAFAKLRGKLPWPARGTLKSHHAGVLIAAQPGTPVRAVAHGRVVYANWLRGYGMLLIVDHGDGWLSLYGDNETLRRDVGDWVDAGTVIATSGRGSAGPGIYFGLRHDGQSVAPRPWLAKHP